MRKSWIAIALIVLAGGIAAGYRIARPGKVPERPARVERESGALPGESAPRGETARAHPAPAAAPDSRREEVPPPPAGDIDEQAPRLPEAEAGRASRETASPPPDPAIIVGTPLPREPVHGGTSSPQGSPPSLPPSSPGVAPPSSPPVAPKTSTAIPANDQGKPDDSAAPTTEDDPESDRRPPTLQYLRFDPVEIKDGGVAVLSVGSTDDLAGIKLVYGSVRSPTGAAIVPFSARDTAGTGVFSAAIAIPAHGETGEWFVSNLQIVDRADNALNLIYARATVPAGGALRVLSEESDSSAPVVHRVSVAKGAVGAGERNQILVEVEDDQSGVAVVTGAFQSPSKSAYVAFTCAPGGDPASWTGDVPVPANADCGEWTLRQLRVVDKANNSAFLSADSPQIGRVGFMVSGGGECDSDPPVIDNMYFTPSIVSNASAADVVVTVAARDDRSGVGSLSGWIDGPVAANGQAPRIYFECIPDPRDPEAPMTAHVTVPRFAAQGVWKVTLAQLADKARNTRVYNRDDPALRDAYFTVE